MHKGQKLEKGNPQAKRMIRGTSGEVCAYYDSNDVWHSLQCRSYAQFGRRTRVCVCAQELQRMNSSGLYDYRDNSHGLSLHFV